MFVALVLRPQFFQRITTPRPPTGTLASASPSGTHVFRTFTSHRSRMWHALSTPWCTRSLRACLPECNRRRSGCGCAFVLFMFKVGGSPYFRARPCIAFPNLLRPFRLHALACIDGRCMLRQSQEAQVKHPSFAGLNDGSIPFKFRSLGRTCVCKTIYTMGPGVQ